MPNQDIEDMSDLYVDCTFNGVTQSSDVHYRSSNGTGFFNWRMVYPIAVPVKDTYLNFKVFDRDMLNSNDYLASSQIDLK